MTVLDVARPMHDVTPDTEVAPMSVVICAYTERRWAGIERAVQSVIDQASGVLEIILIIDHADQLLTRAEHRWPPDSQAATSMPVRVMANVGAQGLSGGRNTGIAAARGEIVAFLDDDAAASPGWAAALLAAFADASVTGAGGAAHADLDGGWPAWWPAEFNWVIGCSWIGLPESPTEVRNVIGCNMAFRRTELAGVAGFSENLGRIGTRPLGCEETDLCIRLRSSRAGARVMYLPGTGVTHTVAPDRLRWSYFQSRCYNEGLSKATVARRNGAASALATERTYVSHVLPRAATRAVWAGLRGESGGFARAAAIVAGTSLTVAGYVRGRLSATSISRERLPRPHNHELRISCRTDHRFTDGSAAPRLSSP